MTAKEFQKLVTEDKSDFLDRFLGLLREKKIAYCIIGGLAVNAYCEPLITLDCDVVVVASRQTELEQALRGLCKMERYAHRLNIIAKGSKPVVTLKKVAVSGERVAGKNRGKIVIADDFDEPLPDFAEYQ